MKLSQTYLFKGKTYGPGDDVDVPEGFPDISKAEKTHAARLAERADASTVNKDGLGVRENAVDSLGNINEPMRNGKTASQTAADADDSSSSTDEAEDLSGYSKSELEDIAEQRGVEIPSKATKAEIVELLSKK